MKRPPDPEALNVDPEDARTLSDFLFLSDAPVDAEVTIVLGMTLWRRPLSRALELHRNGQAGRLLLTGGYNAAIDRVEALAMRDAALAAGVSARDLLVDPRARHTGENFVNCRSLIEAHLPPNPGRRSINVVAIGFHMRRALLTAGQVLGPGPRIGTASYPSVHHTPNDWHLTVRGRADVLGEIRKIARYFPDAVPAGIRRVLQRILEGGAA